MKFSRHQFYDAMMRPNEWLRDEITMDSPILEGKKDADFKVMDARCGKAQHIESIRWLKRSQQTCHVRHKNSLPMNVGWLSSTATTNQLRFRFARRSTQTTYRPWHAWLRLALANLWRSRRPPGWTRRAPWTRHPARATGAPETSSRHERPVGPSASTPHPLLGLVHRGLTSKRAWAGTPSYVCGANRAYRNGHWICYPCGIGSCSPNSMHMDSHDAMKPPSSLPTILMLSLT